MYPRVTPEQSVILKQIGYDVPDTHYYSSIMSNTKDLEPYKLSVEKDFNSTASFRYTRPKLSDVITWLRIKYKVHIYAEPVYGGEKGWVGVVIPLVTFNKFETMAHKEYDDAINESVNITINKINETCDTN